MMRILFIIFTCCIIWNIAVAEEEEPDSTITPISDTIKIIDSTNIADTSITSEQPSDSLSDAERAKQLFEKKLEEHQKERKRHKPGFSFFDTLTTYFTSDRLNRRSDIDRSFYHDAGDYFRVMPSFFILDHQVTPMRKTIQPFGLSGNRLNILMDGYRLQPFEHIPEPDGLVDMNDIPTALDHDIFILPGATGQVFGGQGSVATLMTRPKQPDSYRSESALLADKGGFAYNDVRGRYSKRFFNGREFDMLIQYRKSDGPALNRESDNYYYYGDFLFPLGDNSGLHLWGQLNSHSGPLVVQPEAGGSYVLRNKFDRTARVSYTHDNDDRTSHFETGYKYLRQGSILSGILPGNFNLTGHGLFARRQWTQGNTIVSARIETEYREYDNGYDNYNRSTGDLLLQVGHLNDGLRWAGSAGGQWVEEYGLLPHTALMFFRETASSFMLISGGYSKRAPEMKERYLPYRQSFLYGSQSLPYSEQGNKALSAERQLVGSLIYELGAVDNNIGVSITGGKIWDGIDWGNEIVSDTSGASLLFSPVNGDISFYDIAVQPRIKLKDYLTFVGGAAYHHITYELYADKAYTPDYQIFSGAELHWYWSQKLMDLFAYGDITYVGPYQGYTGQQLGKNLVANVKLSFAIKDYRMHFVFQNVLSNSYRSREYLTFPGRYFYYGFTWQFLD